MEAFPKSHVILTIRNPSHWYDSMRATIYQLRKLTRGPFPLRAAFALAGMFVPGPTSVARLADHLVWEDTFDGRFEEREYAIEVFKASNEEVRRRVPPERLLVFDVRRGWEPLRDFLDVEVPDKPFPRLNKARNMRRRLIVLVAVSGAAPVLAVVGIVVAAVLLIQYRRSARRPRSRWFL